MQLSDFQKIQAEHQELTLYLQKRQEDLMAVMQSLNLSTKMHPKQCLGKLEHLLKRDLDYKTRINQYTQEIGRIREKIQRVIDESKEIENEIYAANKKILLLQKPYDMSRDVNHVSDKQNKTITWQETEIKKLHQIVEDHMLLVSGLQ